MTDNTLGEIKALQKRVVKALETGQEPAPILKELAELRAKIAMETEREQLQKIADQRKALKNSAEAVKAKVQKQGDAVDAFLKTRDNVVKQLQAMLEPLKELAKMGRASWENDSGECYLYNDAGQFQGDVRRIPKELLPEDFKCPTLEMMAPGERSHGKATEALHYFQSCIGILSNFQKGYMTTHSQTADDTLLLDNEPETIEANCLVCSHAQAEAINKGLKEGKSLRELETKFNVSRSTLSRHKNRCLGLGAIQIRE